MLPIMPIERVALREALWFAVCVLSGQGDKAELGIKRAGYMTFSPFVRLRKRRKISGSIRYRVEWVEEPYFPGYTFVALRYEGESLYEINEIHGVATAFRPGKRPMFIPNPVMDQLMTLGDKGEMPVPADHEQWSEGKKFTVAVGHTFAGFVARMTSLTNLDKSGQIRAMLNVLGGDREVTLPAWAVAEIIG